jgi:hypothetical protein
VSSVNYLELVEAVVRSLAEATQAYSARLVGTTVMELVRRLGSDEHIDEALFDLQSMGVLNIRGQEILLTDDARELTKSGLSVLWPSVFNTPLDPDESKFLSVLVELSGAAGDLKSFHHVDVGELSQHAGWEPDPDRTAVLFQSLENKNLIAGVLVLGPNIDELRPTYYGIVRATQHEPTATAQKISELLPEWETTTVEVKVQLSLDRDAEKAEFAKDVCALATTKASGAQRYLVIGFDSKTHAFARSVDPRLTQDRIEQVLNTRCESAPQTKLFTTPWETGTVGLLVILREASKVPYRLNKAMADKFHGERTVFVRHGTQVEPPTPAELADLIAEGERARS